VGSDSKNGVRHQRALSPRLSMMMMMIRFCVACTFWLSVLLLIIFSHLLVIRLCCCYLVIYYFVSATSEQYIGEIHSVCAGCIMYKQEVACFPT